MKAHYDAAYRLQAEGQITRADAEHVAFLASALTKLANAYANSGDYASAQPIYEQGLEVAPNDGDVLRNYAGASLDAQEYEKAAVLLSAVLKNDGKSMSGREAGSLWRMLGDANLALGHRESYLNDYQTALDLDQSCENLFAMGHAHLIIEGRAAVPGAFSEFFSKCGESPVNLFKVGRTYALNQLPEDAAREFEKALSKDSTLPGLHYSLGATYLSRSEQFDNAEAEFRKELALYPDDRYSYRQLGHIALVRHNFREAETDYRHAIANDPLEVSDYIQLGQLLSDEDRRSEAEPLLKRAIELTPDPSKGSYMIQGAHFLLGRMLLKDGKKEDAERELSVSKDLLDRHRQDDLDLLSSGVAPQLPLTMTRIPTEADRKATAEFASRVAPLIAGSYNNLGVHAAMANDFARAARNFELAAQWNPQLAGIDMNWGRAAFFAHMWTAAISPLERALATHPGDSELQGMLATCRGRATQVSP